ncbi:uncharacterized protein B0J16DRAFT_324427 [Fusarium flagelliforme]|uniref:Uncharacterized protein n=1 Tax=Fusarium flagelliforme TaxID=2675880 RepID=A0A395MAI1_9HYPO|nr:uncharacterized protein B0J16DRAFT_324427 [Fusarium flagelliforme]KAH7174971.1 hypothetical protein B0J16DRAFT_324427 [Fusarium flagelliforme]RFN44871.1 hypothetical protein FIE12Z_10852 [Fusarium flagelliforme]
MDADQMDIGAENQSYAEPNPPNPAVEATTVGSWPGFHDETFSTPTERVLLRRSEFLARQLHLVLANQERILVALNKRTRRSSMSSTGTGVSDSTEGNEVNDSSISFDDPAITKAYDTFCDPESDEHAALTNVHREFIDAQKKKLYVKRTPHSTVDAMAFKAYIQSTFAGNEEEVAKSIVDGFDLLNTDLITGVYLALNREMKKKKSNSKGKGKSAAASTPAHGKGEGESEASGQAAGDEDLPSSPLPTRLRKRRRAQYLTSANPAPVGDGDDYEPDEDDGDGASTPKARRSLTSMREISNSTNSQVSLTSVEIRRSHQQTRFESEGDFEGHE